MKVLIADDDRVTRTILAETVERLGHEVIVAADGHQALELLEAGEIRVAILDWTMPCLDGPEVCAIVRAQKSAVYVILLSARTKPEHVLEGLAAGADDYLVKPFATTEIQARIRVAEQMLEGEVVSREAARAARFGLPLGFLLLDGGDDVVERVAERLSARDHVLRWGNEILVVLPEASSFQAVRIAERIRALVDGAIGVSELTRNGPSAREAIEAAHAALQRAKGDGNCVKRAGEDVPTLPPPSSHQDAMAHSNPPP
jgi:PleD family two-component response regulator